MFLPENRSEFEACQDSLSRLNRAVAEAIGERDVFRVATAKKDGFGLQRVEHLIENRAEGQIHTGQMMSCLLRLATEKGVRILNGLDVAALQASPARLRCDSATNGK